MVHVVCCPRFDQNTSTPQPSSAACHLGASPEHTNAVTAQVTPSRSRGKRRHYDKDLPSAGTAEDCLSPENRAAGSNSGDVSGNDGCCGDFFLQVPVAMPSSRSSSTSSSDSHSQLRNCLISLQSDVAGKDDIIESLRQQLTECQEALEDSKRQRKEAEQSGEEHRVSNELATAKLTVSVNKLLSVCLFRCVA